MTPTVEEMQKHMQRVLEFHGWRLGVHNLTCKLMNDDEMESRGEDVLAYIRGTRSQITLFGRFTISTKQRLERTIYLRRRSVEELWGEKEVEDLLVHEIMHFKCRTDGDGHGGDFFEAMLKDGRSPMGVGSLRRLYRTDAWFLRRLEEEGYPVDAVYFADAEKQMEAQS